MGQLIALPLHG